MCDLCHMISVRLTTSYKLGVAIAEDAPALETGDKDGLKQRMLLPWPC